MNKYKYHGMWPVAPTPFHENGEVDYEGMNRVIDCMVDQKVEGICILANYSEQFLISDEEREKLTKLCMKKIDGRVKTIVTVSHFATDIVRPRAELAKSLGADIIMMMPPYHGALLKGYPDQIFEQFNEISKVGIPIMIQDAPFDGEESITLYADLEAGISGSMSSALLPEKIAPVIDQFWNNEKDKAEEVYNSILPLINFENRQCGFRATKTVMKEGGVIKSDFCRDPIKPLDLDTKNLLLNFAKRYDLLTYKWGK